MLEDDNSPSPHRWVALLIAAVCLGIAVWIVQARMTRSQQKYGGADEPEAAPADNTEAESSQSAGLRAEPPIAAAPPAGASVSFGTQLPGEGSLPSLVTSNKSIRWPTKPGDAASKPQETALPQATLASGHQGLFVTEGQRFEAMTTQVACSGFIDPELQRVEVQLAERSAAIIDRLALLTVEQQLTLRVAEETRQARDAEAHLRATAEATCDAKGLGALAWFSMHRLGAGRDRMAALDHVALTIKSMKPKAAAKVAEGWDETFAAQAFGRLPPRVVAPVAAKMDPERAGRVLETWLAHLAFGGGKP